MPVITCIVTYPLGRGQYLSDIRDHWWRARRDHAGTDLVLVSAGQRFSVHQALVVPLSPLLQQLLPPHNSCRCEAPAVTLPPVSRKTLHHLLQLIYLGKTRIDSPLPDEQLDEIVRILQIDVGIICEEVEGDETIILDTSNDVDIEREESRTNDVTSVDYGEPESQNEVSDAKRDAIPSTADFRLGLISSDQAEFASSSVVDNNNLTEKQYETGEKTNASKPLAEEAIGREKCPLCRKDFSRLKEHLSTKHFKREIMERLELSIDQSEYNCKFCSKSYRRIRDILGHVGSYHLVVDELLAKRNDLAKEKENYTFVENSELSELEDNNDSALSNVEQMQENSILEGAVIEKTLFETETCAVQTIDDGDNRKVPGDCIELVPENVENKLTEQNKDEHNSDKLDMSIRDKIIEDENGKYHCKDCTYTSKQKKIIVNHVKEGHVEMSCQFCKEIYRGNKELKLHVRRAHTRKSESMTSPKRNQSQPPKISKSLAQEMRAGETLIAPGVLMTMSPSGVIETLRCDYCGVDMKTMSKLVKEAHWSTNDFHEALLRDYSGGESCKICNRAYQNESELAKHIGVEHKKVYEYMTLNSKVGKTLSEHQQIISDTENDPQQTKNKRKQVKLLEYSTTLTKKIEERVEYLKKNNILGTHHWTTQTGLSSSVQSKDKANSVDPTDNNDAETARAGKISKENETPIRAQENKNNIEYTKITQISQSVPESTNEKYSAEFPPTTELAEEVVDPVQTRTHERKSVSFQIPQKGRRSSPRKKQQDLGPISPTIRSRSSGGKIGSPQMPTVDTVFSPHSRSKSVNSEIARGGGGTISRRSTPRKKQQDPRLKSQNVSKSPVDSSGRRMCTICGATLANIYKLKEHMSLVHFSKELESHLVPGTRCNICDKAMGQRQALIRHVGAVHDLVLNYAKI